MSEKLRVVLISDTHTSHRKLDLPDGDVLIHAGDFTNNGTIQEISDFNDWLGSLSHSKKIVVAGNHDGLFEDNPALARSLLTNGTYLQDSGEVVEGLNIYGAPWQPRLRVKDWSFGLEPGSHRMKRAWARIPDEVDVLITHGPPWQILDKGDLPGGLGCMDLRKELDTRLRPRIHVFGHIHMAYGREDINGTAFINAASCDYKNEIAHEPVVMDLDIK